MEEKSGECEEDIFPVGCWENGLPGCQIARYLGVTTSSVNRLAVPEETADLKKYLKML
jgi:hypothetical protein